MKRTIFLALALLLVLTACGAPSEASSQPLELVSVTPIPSTPTTTPEPTPVPDFNVSMNSPYAGLYRLSDGTALFEKNAGNRMYPASMTKIMTALVALEGLRDLEEPVTLEPELFEALWEADASLAGFSPGETAAAIDLVYGVMLPSGAECCIGLADDLYGGEEAFVERMNEKAAELGLKDTHFVNTSGLHDPEHYTTVRDLRTLLTAALQNETFRAVFCAARYTTQPTEAHPEGITFRSTMFSQMESADLAGGRILGGKTGYTSQAGQCLASLAEWNGEEYLCITGGAIRDEERNPLNIWDAFAAYGQLSE